MLFEIAERFLEIGVQFPFTHDTHHAAACAISAITGATISDQEQDAVRIPMHQTRYRHVRIFAARIGHVVGRRPRFFDPWNDLTPDWILRIFFSRNQIEKVRRDREREFVAGKQNAAAFFFAKIDMLLELSERGDPIFELPFPIVPEFRRDLRPVARCMRDKRFSILFCSGESDHF